MSRLACHGTPMSISPPSLTAKAQVRSLLALLGQEYESTQILTTSAAFIKGLVDDAVQKGAKIELPEGGWKQVLFFFMIGSSGPAASLTQKKRDCASYVLKKALTDRVEAASYVLKKAGGQLDVLKKIHMSLKRRLQIGWKQEGNLIHPVVLTGVTADMR